MKDIKDMTFDEIVSWAEWNVISGLCKGESLRSIIYGIVTVLAQLWNTGDVK